MKLITEHVEDISFIVEETNGKKNLYIEGVYLQAEKPNRNKRVYSKPILGNAVKSYVTEQVSKGRGVGELGHPSNITINLDKVSHRITDLHWEGNDVYGKALVLNTPMGVIVQGLRDGGVKLGVSSRGMGSLQQKGGYSHVKEDYRLAAIDIVQDPSAPDAWVEGVLEGVEWVKVGDEFFEKRILPKGMVKEEVVEEAVRNLKQTMKKDPPKNLHELQIKMFKDFLGSL